MRLGSTEKELEVGEGQLDPTLAAELEGRVLLANERGVEQPGPRFRRRRREPVLDEQATDEGVSRGVDARDCSRGALVVRCPSAHRSVEGAAVAKDDPSELSQAFGRRLTSVLDGVDDLLGRRSLPGDQHRIEERPSVRKMPIEAALRDAEGAGQRFHANGFDSFIRHETQGHLCPDCSAQTFGHRVTIRWRIDARKRRS